MNTNRRIDQNRRKINFRLLSDLIERRKIPDRRSEGMDVYDIDVNEKEFLVIFGRFLPNN